MLISLRLIEKNYAKKRNQLINFERITIETTTSTIEQKRIAASY